jgi:hypothetical protein
MSSTHTSKRRVRLRFIHREYEHGDGKMMDTGSQEANGPKRITQPKAGRVQRVEQLPRRCWVCEALGEHVERVNELLETRTLEQTSHDLAAEGIVISTSRLGSHRRYCLRGGRADPRGRARRARAETLAGEMAQQPTNQPTNTECDQWTWKSARERTGGDKETRREVLEAIIEKGMQYIHTTSFFVTPQLLIAATAEHSRQFGEQKGAITCAYRRCCPSRTLLSSSRKQRSLM